MMTRNQAIYCMTISDCDQCDYFDTPQCYDMASDIAARDMKAIKLLGDELRIVRGGIKDESALIGFNMAVAIYNKYLKEENNDTV